MRSDAPALMPIFRSEHQAVMLTHLYLHPEQDFTATQLAAQAGVPLSTAHRELSRLVEAGLLVARPVGRSRLLRANSAHRGASALTDLLLGSFGPLVVVSEEFAPVEGAEQVLVFGSWAARHAGVGGPPPGDVDVLVIGDADRAQVYDAAERCEQRLALPVNPVLRRSEQWWASAEEQDPLVHQVRASEHLVLLRADGAGPATTGQAS